MFNMQLPDMSRFKPLLDNTKIIQEVLGSLDKPNYGFFVGFTKGEVTFEFTTMKASLLLFYDPNNPNIIRTRIISNETGHTLDTNYSVHYLEEDVKHLDAINNSFNSPHFNWIHYDF